MTRPIWLAIWRPSGSPACRESSLGHLAPQLPRPDRPDGSPPKVFTAVSIPDEVRAELASSRAPSAIQEWIRQPPAWLVIDSTPLSADAVLDRLHAGERAAILLAERLGADVVLLDEKAARTVAVGRGLRVSGLLGVLREAASRGLVDLPTAVQALLSVGFRASPALLKSLLGTH